MKPDRSSPPSAPLPGARLALFMLIAINLFNYIDRQVLMALVPRIEDAFLLDDPNAGKKLGLLSFAFMASYLAMSPVFGLLAESLRRWFLVGVGVTLWSLASGASGWAASYWVLFATRCFVGIGEAAYGPAAPTIIADLFPIQHRGRVMAWFYMAIPVGGALGYVLGGMVADSRWLLELGVEPGDRWRWAFYLVVPPGLLLGVSCFFFREPTRGGADSGRDTPTRKPRLADYKVLLGNKSYVLNTLGMTAMTFAIGGVAAWMPTYIWEREARFTLTEDAIQALAQGRKPVPKAVLDRLASLQDKVFDSRKTFEAALAERLDADSFQKHRETLVDIPAEPKLGWVNTIFGAVIVVAGLSATLVGGIVGDRLQRRYSGSYFLVSGIAMLAGFPLFLLVLIVPFPWAWAFVFLSCFSLFFNTGPTNTILANVTHPSIRATAFAINILVIHALGDAISPFVIGAIRDAASLALGFLAVSVTMLVSGAIWLMGVKHLRHDTETVMSQLDAPGG